MLEVVLVPNVHMPVIARSLDGHASSPEAILAVRTMIREAKLVRTGSPAALGLKVAEFAQTHRVLDVSEAMKMSEMLIKNVVGTLTTRSDKLVLIDSVLQDFEDMAEELIASTGKAGHDCKMCGRCRAHA